MSDDALRQIAGFPCRHEYGCKHSGSLCESCIARAALAEPARAPDPTLAETRKAAADAMEFASRCPVYREDVPCDGWDGCEDCLAEAADSVLAALNRIGAAPGRAPAPTEEHALRVVIREVLQTTLLAKVSMAETVAERVLVAVLGVRAADRAAPEPTDADLDAIYIAAYRDTVNTKRLAIAHLAGLRAVWAARRAAPTPPETPPDVSRAYDSLGPCG